MHLDVVRTAASPAPLCRNPVLATLQLVQLTARSPSGLAGDLALLPVEKEMKCALAKLTSTPRKMEAKSAPSFTNAVVVMQALARFTARSLRGDFGLHAQDLAGTAKACRGLPAESVKSSSVLCTVVSVARSCSR